MKKMRFVSVIFCIVLTMSVIMPAAVFAANEYWGGSNGLNEDNNGWGDNDINLSKTTKVGFYIQINGEQMDINGNVSARDKEFFTNILAESTLKKNLNANYTLALDKNAAQSELTDKLSSVPDQDKVFKKIAAQYKQTDASIYSSNGKLIPWSKLTTDYYKIRWYVLKYEKADFWHVDGVIVDLETDKEISIVVPDKDAERAACVEYDVKTGKFTPGFMNVMANRPHSYWKGSNDELVVDGFHDVWYTVLDEKSFKANTAAIPSDLIDAATAIEKLAGARLSELDKKLRKQYGRIDSQAYKQEYIDRSGAGRTLFVTPFITKMLSSKNGVSTDKYVWLAMGDSNGNISKVYVMNRSMANVENLFDEE